MRESIQTLIFKTNGKPSHPDTIFFYNPERVKPWTHSQIIELEYYRPVNAHKIKASEEYNLRQLSGEVQRSVEHGHELTLQTFLGTECNSSKQYTIMCGNCYYLHKHCTCKLTSKNFSALPTHTVVSNYVETIDRLIKLLQSSTNP